MTLRMRRKKKWMKRLWLCFIKRSFYIIGAMLIVCQYFVIRQIDKEPLLLMTTRYHVITKSVLSNHAYDSMTFTSTRRKTTPPNENSIIRVCHLLEKLRVIGDFICASFFFLFFEQNVLRIHGLFHFSYVVYKAINNKYRTSIDVFHKFLFKLRRVIFINFHSWLLSFFLFSNITLFYVFFS